MELVKNYKSNFARMSFEVSVNGLEYYLLNFYENPQTVKRIDSNNRSMSHSTLVFFIVERMIE